MMMDPSQVTYRAYKGEARARLREMILYVCKACEKAKYFGSLKLYKIIYNADFRFYAVNNRPISGAAYYALEHGPVPKMSFPLLREMREQGLLEIREEAIDDDGLYVQHRHVAMRGPAKELFTAEELSFLDKVIAEYWDMSGTQLSKDSHRRNYHLVGLYGDIPYESVFLSDSTYEPTEEDVEVARLLAESISNGSV